MKYRLRVANTTNSYYKKSYKIKVTVDDILVGKRSAKTYSSKTSALKAKSCLEYLWKLEFEVVEG